MYAGHFATALAIKARSPETPTWIPLLGVGLLDILFGPFVLLGWERVTMTPGISPGFRLDYIDWSHSLVMSVVWSLVFAALFWRRGRQVAIVAGIAVFSHYVLDFFMHPGDLALWPGSTVHWGLGLWTRLPDTWWFVELAFIGVLGAYYWNRARNSTAFGGRAAWAVGAVVLLHVMNAPWLSPAA